MLKWPFQRLSDLQIGDKGGHFESPGCYLYTASSKKFFFTLKVRKRSYSYSSRFRTFSTFPKFSPWKKLPSNALQCKNDWRDLLVEAIWVSIHWSYAKNHPSRYKKWWEVLISMLGHPLKRTILRPKKNKTSRVGSFPFATIFVGLWQLVFTPQKDDSIQFHGTFRNVSNWR